MKRTLVVFLVVITVFASVFLYFTLKTVDDPRITNRAAASARAAINEAILEDDIVGEESRNIETQLPETSATISSDAQPEPEYTLSVTEEEEADRDKLYILMYHDVKPDGSECNSWETTTGCFIEDIKWLKNHNYHFYLPSEIAAGAPLAEKSVMLTFDDGYDSGYYYVSPILNEYNAKAVIAIIVKLTEDNTPSFLTWDMCKKMISTGKVEIESHTYDCHKNGIWRKDGETEEEYHHRVIDDITLSKTLIEEKLGTDCCYFAYPHGRQDTWANNYIMKTFDMSVTTEYGIADLSERTNNLPRIGINTTVRPWDVLPE